MNDVTTLPPTLTVCLRASEGADTFAGRGGPRIVEQPHRREIPKPEPASLKAAIEAAEGPPPHTNQFLEIEIVASLVQMPGWIEDIPFLEAEHFITLELGEILTAVRWAQAEGRKVTAAWVARQLGIARFLGGGASGPTLRDAFERLLDFPTGIVRANIIPEAQELVALAALRQNVAAWTEPPAADAAPAEDLARRTRETVERWDVAESIASRKPTPSTWREPQDIPPRDRLYGHHYRGFLSALVGPGARGKSSLLIGELLDAASGKGIFYTPRRPLRCWYWCGEDPLDELERRKAAFCRQHGITAADLGNRFMMDSGRDMPLTLVRFERGVALPDEAAIRRLIVMLRESEIDVFALDPLRAVHKTPENDNTATEEVALALRRIAHEAQSAGEVAHHTRKSNGAFDLDVDSARGAKSLTDATRKTRVLNVMSEEEAERAKIPKLQRSLYVRIDDAKANFTAPADRAVWRKLASVNLGNATEDLPADEVQAVVAWTMPSPLEGVTVGHLDEVVRQMGQREYPADSRNSEWLGRLVARVIGADVDNKADRMKVLGLIKVWIKSGVLEEGDRPRPGKGDRMEPIIRVKRAPPLDI